MQGRKVNALRPFWFRTKNGLVGDFLDFLRAIYIANGAHVAYLISCNIRRGFDWL